MQCWASCLSNCGEGISREHYISDGIFDGVTVTTYGLPWFRQETVTIGLKTAVAKILCGRHNNALSDFDGEAAKLSKFLPNVLARDFDAQGHLLLRGTYLEKWALKTFLNLGYLGALDREQPNPLQPPESLVRYVYLNTPIAEGIGLYFVSSEINDRNYEAGVSWCSVRSRANPNQVCGMTLKFYGLRFVVSISPKLANEMIAGMGEVNDLNYSQEHISYRPTTIVLNSDTTNVKTIELQWDA